MKRIGKILLASTLVMCSALSLACDKSHEHVYNEGTTLKVVDGILYTYNVCDCGDIDDGVAVENAVVVTPETVQAELDSADGEKLVYLTAGDYGTLYLRQSALSTNVDSTWAGGTVGTSKHRAISDLTLLGADGVNVSTIKVEAATYTPDGNQHSNSATAPYLNSFITLKNITVKNVNFAVPESATNYCAFDVASARVSIDGLTVEDCTVSSASQDDKARIVYVGAYATESKDKNGEVIIDGAVKNVTIKNCTTNNLHQVVEFREVENLVIENNTFNDTRAQVLLLNGKINGLVIKDNKAVNSLGRFLRGTGFDGTVEISGNETGNNFVDEGSIVKITGTADGATLNVSNNVWNGVSDAKAIEDGLLLK